MPDSKLDIVEREVGDVTVLQLSGQMLLDDGDLALRRAVHALVDRGRLKVLVDLRAVSYIDSAGVGMLVAKMQTLRTRGGDMKLLNLGHRTHTLLGMMKLHLAFETFDDEPMAIKSFTYSTH